ncbi:hypothetical protein M514_01184 [Trichuris suis]|uniref:Centrosomal protein of 290kDa coiled-coil region domain-containing protein n=1 Tax=Trichuris suis TaxID=68888 RepID=A0A085NN21_9BILA|nr:hypothetical protein M514_01184 [Trichuris suis]
MGFSKWDELQNLDFDNFDEADVESWVPIVVSANVDGEEDPKRLKALFYLSKVLLEVKAAQAEIALDELEHLTGQKTNVNDTREQRLTIENNNLKEKLAASLAAYSDCEKSMFVLKEELQELREQNQQLALEYDELHSEMVSDKEAATKNNAKIEQYEKEVQSLSQERNELLANLRDTQRQLESQEDVDVLARRLELNELQLKIRSQNQEALTETNDIYQRQIKELKDSLQESVAQMELAADECLQLKTTNDQLGKLVDSLQAENNELRDQINNSDASIIQKADDHVMSMVDEKIGEWKQRLDDKNEELNECKAKIAAQEIDISHYKSGVELASVSALQKVLLEREEQIECLKNALKEATREMEANASLIEGLNAELRSGKCPRKDIFEVYTYLKNLLKENQVAIVDLRRQLRAAQMEIRSLRQSLEENEMARMEKERQLADLLSRMRQFEEGEYGLEEAVSEIYLLKKRLTIRNEQLYELIQHCNLVELNLSELFDENNTFRERLKLEKRAPLNIEFKTTAQAVEKGTELPNIAPNGQLDRAVAERTVSSKEETPSPEIREERLSTQEPLFPISTEVVDKEISKDVVASEEAMEAREAAPVLVPEVREPKQDEITAQTEEAVEEMETVASTIADVQADIPSLGQLNECMRKLVKEVEGKKKQLAKLNCALTIAKQKLGSLNRQYTLKCEELTQCREAMEKERVALNGTIDDQRTKIEMGDVKITELEHMVDLLSKGDEDLIKRRIVEVVRQQILTRLENVCLKRRLLLSERSLKDANNVHARLKADASDLRSALSKKTAFFEKRQKVSIYKIASLRRKLDASVPATEFQQLETQYKELFQKYANGLLSETLSAVAGLEPKNVEGYKAKEEPMELDENSEDRSTKSWPMVGSRYPYEQQDSDYANELEEPEEDNIDEVMFDERKELERLRVEQAVEIEQLRQLHCEIVSLKLAGIDKDNKIKEALCLEEKMKSMKHAMEENLKKVKKAKSNFQERENTLIGQINELKKNLRESIPVKMAEKFHTIGNRLIQVEAKSVEVEDRANALAIREKVLEKLISSIENEEQRDQLIAMSEKVERLKVENSKLDRLVKRLQNEDESNRSLIRKLKENIFKLSSDANLLDATMLDADLSHAVQEYDILRRTSSPKIEDKVEAVINKEADWLDEEIDRLKLFIKDKLSATSRWNEQAMAKPVSISSTSPQEVKREVYDHHIRESFVDTFAPLLQAKISEREDRFDSCGKRIQALEEEVAFLRAQYNIILSPPDEVESGKADAPAKRRKEKERSPRESLELLEQKIEKYKQRIVELEETIRLKEKEIAELKESAARWQKSRSEHETKQAEQLSTASVVSEEGETESEAPDEAKYEEPESVESVRLSDHGSLDESQPDEAGSISEQPSFAEEDSSPKVVEDQSPLPPARVETVPLEMHLKLKVEWERLKQANKQLQLDNRKLVKALAKLKEEFMKTAVAQKAYGAEMKERPKLSTEIEDHPQEGETALDDAAKLELESVKRKLALKEIRLSQVTREMSSLSAENKRLKSEIDTFKSSPIKKSGEFGKWTEYKKWQTLYENGKVKLAAKMQEIAKLKKTEERLRSRIIRLEQQINFMESSRNAEEVGALQETAKSLLKAQSELTTSTSPGDAAMSTRKQKTQSQVTLIRATAEEAEKTVETLENKVRELFKVIESKNKAEEQYLDKQKLLERQLRESEQKARQLEKNLQASVTVLKDRSAREGVTDEQATAQAQFKDGRRKNERSWNYLKQKITVTKCIDNDELKNQVSVSTQREIFQPWLSMEDSSSPINKLIRENNILRKRLKHAQIELEEAYKDIEYYKANQSLPSLGTWQKAGDSMRDKQDVSKMLKDEKSQRSRFNMLQEMFKKEIEKCHQLKIENDRLNRKIEALDGALRCDSFTENNVFQNLKIMNFELLEEIDDLKFELEVYRKKIKPALTGNDALVDVEKLKERGKIYDRVLRENVELKLELSLARQRA